MSFTLLNSFSWVVKYKKVLFIVFPIIPLCIGFFIYYHRPVNFIQKSETNPSIEYILYNDQQKGGHSHTAEIKDPETIRFTYTLREGLPYPYAGIALYGTQDQHLDFSEYDFIKLKLKASKGKRFPFIVNTFCEGHTQPGNYNSYRNNQVIINVNDKMQEIRIPMKDLKTPEWWFTQNSISETSLSEPDYSKVQSIGLSSCIALGKNIEDSIEIEEISFHVDLFPFFIWSLGATIIYYLVGIFLVRKKKAPVSEIHFVYKKTEAVNHLEKQEQMIFQFLTTNYPRESLTILEVQNAIGINEQKISSIIRTKTGKSFKQFLNKLRISEAKRLLKETDLQISEIAFKVGYANVSHFNRVFKELENCSPNDFRKQETHTLS